MSERQKSVSISNLHFIELYKQQIVQVNSRAGCAYGSNRVVSTSHACLKGVVPRIGEIIIFLFIRKARAIHECLFDTCLSNIY